MILSLVVIVHALFFFFLSIKWRDIRVEKIDTESFVNISVLVPMRDEELRIQSVLDSLTTVRFDGNWEVIFIDDFSSDQTKKIVEEFIKKRTSIRAQIMSSTMQGKKYALTKGVYASRYEYIVTLDADCSFEPQILTTYNAYFSRGYQFVAGPVKMLAKNFFQQLQVIEFAGLNSAGAVLIDLGSPFYCNGANMGYAKKAFENVGGYEGNDHIASGDDQFLLQKMAKKYPMKIAYVKSINAIVTTEAEPTFKSLKDQRIRWSSKWKKLNSFKILLGSGLFFLSYLSPLLLIALAIFGHYSLLQLVGLLLIKSLSEWYLIKTIQPFFAFKRYSFAVLSLQIIYPLFVIFLSIASIFGTYSWKGRSYDR